MSEPIVVVLSLDPNTEEGRRIMSALQFASALTKSPSAPREVSERQWFSVTSAATYCGCSRSKIYADLKAGLLRRDNTSDQICAPLFKQKTLDNYRSGITRPVRKPHGNTKAIA
jgi:hypothetical protein